MELELTLAIIKAILTYGPKAVVTISEAFKTGEVTAEDIDKLFITKSPEDYFK